MAARRLLGREHRDPSISVPQLARLLSTNATGTRPTRRSPASVRRPSPPAPTSTSGTVGGRRRVERQTRARLRRFDRLGEQRLELGGGRGPAGAAGAACITASDATTTRFSPRRRSGSRRS
jgi:hypothetical protein